MAAKQHVTVVAATSAVLVAPEVDDPVLALVAATTVTCCFAAIAVAATG